MAAVRLLVGTLCVVASFFLFGPATLLIATATEQINWIYTGKNNPFFQAFKNSNDDTRDHVIEIAVLGS